MPEIPLPSPETLSAVSRAAIVLALLLNLGSLPSARHIAEKLGLERRTVSTYLRRLSKLGYIRPNPDDYGYLLVENLTPEQQRLLAFLTPPISKSPNLEENAPVLGSFSTTTYYLNPDQSSKKEVSSSKTRKPKNPKKQPKPGRFSEPPAGGDPEVWLALGQAGIFGEKQASLSLLPDLNAQTVRLLETQLRSRPGRRYSPGLLIHVLESGDPAPPTNARGHLLDCTCPDCSRKEYSRCIYCHQIPCECGMNPVET
jgi:DNA-binding MarR family transcriptional regulator